MSICLSLCGSMSFIDEMEAIAVSLELSGCRILTPVREEKHIDWSDTANASVLALKRSFIDRHLEKIRSSNAVLIANFRKNGIDGYVGPNTMMEAAFAHALDIPVFFLHDPAQQRGGLECASISHGCLDGKAEDVLQLLQRS